MINEPTTKISPLRPLLRPFRRSTPLALAAMLVLPALAQSGDPEAGFEAAASTAQRDLERSVEQLNALREQIAQERAPLNRELRRLEGRLSELRTRSQQLGGELDTQNLELATLQSETRSREEETGYLSNLLDEYVRNLESRIHITELQRHGPELQAARLAPDEAALSTAERFSRQTAAVEQSIDRLADNLGGAAFEGQVVGRGGVLEDAEFVLLGPLALFSTKDGASSGVAEQQVGSLEPQMFTFDEPERGAEVRQIVSTGRGLLPFDPTLGDARKIEATEETWREHVAKGGPVMIPILLLAGAALAIGIYKWLQLARVREPPPRRVSALLDAVRRGDHEAAREAANKIGGPTGEMLASGVEHITDPKELVEEVMYERVLETQLQMNRFLSFVAVTAAAAPLMGLLGTVTGIINTFKLITVYGTGDASTLSSGISEALITTEFGLIVAIPALFLHAYLSRKSRRFIDRMEKTAVSFLNRLIASQSGGSASARAGRGTTAAAPGTVQSMAPPLGDAGGALAAPGGTDH
jgi:biopolymer transport protein ExbB